MWMSGQRQGVSSAGLVVAVVVLVVVVVVVVVDTVVGLVWKTTVSRLPLLAVFRLMGSTVWTEVDLAVVVVAVVGAEVVVVEEILTL